MTGQRLRRSAVALLVAAGGASCSTAADDLSAPAVPTTSPASSPPAATPSDDPSVVRLGAYGSVRLTRGWRPISLATLDEAARTDPGLAQLADNLRSGASLAVLATTTPAGGIAVLAVGVLTAAGPLDVSARATVEASRSLGLVEVRPRQRTSIDGRPAVRLQLGADGAVTDSTWVVSLGPLVLTLRFEVPAGEAAAMERAIVAQAAAVDVTY